MIYFVLYIVIGTIIFIWTYDNFNVAAKRHDMESDGERGFAAILGILFWPIFLGLSIARLLRGER